MLSAENGKRLAALEPAARAVAFPFQVHVFSCDLLLVRD